MFGSVTCHSKKFTVTVNYFPERNKKGPEKDIVFGHFPTISDYFNISQDYRRLDEDVQGLPKKSEYYRRFPRRNRKIFEFIFVVMSHGKEIFLQFTDSNFLRESNSLQLIQ